MKSDNSDFQLTPSLLRAHTYTHAPHMLACLLARSFTSHTIQDYGFVEPSVQVTRVTHTATFDCFGILMCFEYEYYCIWNFTRIIYLSFASNRNEAISLRNDIIMEMR